MKCYACEIGINLHFLLRHLSKPFDEFKIKKTNLRSTCGVTSQRVTSGRIRLRDLAPEQHRNVAAVASRGRQNPIEPVTSPTESDVVNHQTHRPLNCSYFQPSNYDRCSKIQDLRLEAVTLLRNYLFSAARSFSLSAAKQ